MGYFCEYVRNDWYIEQINKSIWIIEYYHKYSRDFKEDSTNVIGILNNICFN